MTITVGYHQTNRKVDTGKTLNRWPVLVDHYIARVYEQEFTELASKILLAEFEITEGLLKAAMEFVLLSGHPAGTCLIFYPQDFNITTPQSMVNVIKDWRQRHNLPCFSNEYLAVSM